MIRVENPVLNFSKLYYCIVYKQVWEKVVRVSIITDATNEEMFNPKEIAHQITG